jgi:hypothetical protein
VEIELLPLRGVGLLALGMPVESAEQVMRMLPGYMSAGSSLLSVPGRADYSSGMGISTEVDGSGRVRAIEIYHTKESGDIVLNDGRDVFAETADEIIAWLGGRFDAEVREDGLALVVPELSLAFWRPVMPERGTENGEEYYLTEGEYFLTVTVAEPGYFALP